MSKFIDDNLLSMNIESIQTEYRLNKLKIFMVSDEYNLFDETFKKLTKCQMQTMEIYLDILKKRIELMEKEILSYTE